MTRYRAFRRLVPVLAAALVVAPLVAPSLAADDMSEIRTVAGFENIRLEGAFSTEISAGEHRTQVVITGSRDDVPRVTAKVVDGTLVVGMEPDKHSSTQPLKLAITLPALHSFVNAGAGSAKISALTGGDIAIENDGAASIVASGRAMRAHITLNGAGRIDTTAVKARDVTVDNNGVGSVRVRASGQLTMNVNGVGEIRYTGDPANVESHVNGIGSIRRL